jgi:hypothetical protein
MSLQIGDRVRWSNEKFGRSGSVGIVVNVLLMTHDLPDFNLYDVKFDFGVRTLHASELTLLPSLCSCEERERLLIGFKKVSEIYTRMVWELVGAVGTMAHVKFEFLSQKVAVARHAAREARDQLNKHRAEHGC